MIRKNFVLAYWLLAVYVSYSLVVTLFFSRIGLRTEEEVISLYGASSAGAVILLLILIELVFLWFVFFKEGNEDKVVKIDTLKKTKWQHPVYWAGIEIWKT